jgi:hypothetical protein
MTITSIGGNEDTVAGRYLAGQLSDAERAAFEVRLKENPEVLREVEATARLKVGLARLRERGELDELLAPPAWTGKWLMLATAAALVMVVMGVMLSRFYPGQSQRPILAASIDSLVDTQGGVLPVRSTLAVFRKRAATDDAVIESASAGAVELRVLPETLVESRRYRVSLARMSDDRALEPVASIDGLRPAADGFVTMFIDASQLASGRYRLDVSGEVPDSNAGVTDTFLIRVRPSPAP